MWEYRRNGVGGKQGLGRCIDWFVVRICTLEMLVHSKLLILLC